MPNGLLCVCGKRGCLETVASERALLTSITLARLARSSKLANHAAIAAADEVIFQFEAGTALVRREV